MATPQHLHPSELGTKEYWDTAYAYELHNHAASPADHGTIWFDDAGAEERVVSFLDDLAEEGRLDKNSATVLDLGTGNGHMLFALRDEGWSGGMVGVDYSAQSVHLARMIEEERKRAEGTRDGAHVEEREENDSAGETRPVRFEEFDILAGSSMTSKFDWIPPDRFDLVLDKGTFDAISLCGQTDAQGRRLSEKYAESVLPLVKKGGRLLVTSCNWTEEELRAWLEAQYSNNGSVDGRFEFDDRIKYPSFTFGGKTGQQVVTLTFVRR